MVRNLFLVHKPSVILNSLKTITLGAVNEAIKKSTPVLYWPQFCEFNVSSGRNI